jgi:succinate dehydrogenase / fumarate reductase flavoprotein subunit
MMQELVGIVRVEEEMQRAVTGIAELRKKEAVVAVKGNREYNPGWSTALDLHNLLTVSEAVARSALLRKESRGGHFRADFEKKSDEWSKKNIVLKKGGDGSMQISTAPIKEMPPELKQIIESEAK